MAASSPRLSWSAGRTTASATSCSALAHAVIATTAVTQGKATDRLDIDALMAHASVLALAATARGHRSMNPSAVPKPYCTPRVAAQALRDDALGLHRHREHVAVELEPGGLLDLTGDAS